MVKTSLPNAGDASSIPGQGAKTLYASWAKKKKKSKNIKQKQYCNEFNKDLKKENLYDLQFRTKLVKALKKRYQCRTESQSLLYIHHKCGLPLWLSW